MERSLIMDSIKTTARAAGILYLMIIIFAGFSAGYVRSGIIVPGNAEATATNIMASEGLFRIGFVSDLIAFLTDAAVAVLLFVLLRPVSKTLSVLAAALRLLAHPAIAAINLLNHFIPLLLLGNADYLSAFQSEQLYAMVMIFLDAHTTGYLIAGAFFGVHLLLLGWLLFRSDLFPGILGILVFIASLGYLTESFGNFLVPGHESVFAWIVAIPAVIGELSFALWLVIKGVRNPQPAGARR